MFTHKHPLTKKLLIIYLLVVGGFLSITFMLLRFIGPVSTSKLPGMPIDSLNSIPVYYNGDIHHVGKEITAANGYVLGVEWQCVEFVKRYYFIRFNHIMPNSSGNAKDFFDKQLSDASYNYARELVQYANPSLKQPAVEDIIVFDGSLLNNYGHIAIISAVSEDHIEIIQQNGGPDAPSRIKLDLVFENSRWEVKHKRVLGWLRIE
ncbi:MAG: CHAP domain-containing protein [Bacteroidetes bacterium]|jgi:hypothetical protein|nr:CHAP domain-containing protein [Bacteroidota bacterium]MBP9878949.1 CHAP domain-containing protein [Chitinophagales bacterium]